MSQILTENPTPDTLTTAPNCKDCLHYQPKEKWYYTEDQSHEFAGCSKSKTYASSERLLPHYESEFFDFANCGTEGTWFEPILEVGPYAVRKFIPSYGEIATLALLLAVLIAFANFGSKTIDFAMSQRVSDHASVGGGE